jgi:hypothetical protein
VTVTDSAQQHKVRTPNQFFQPMPTSLVATDSSTTNAGTITPADSLITMRAVTTMPTDSVLAQNIANLPAYSAETNTIITNDTLSVQNKSKISNNHKQRPTQENTSKKRVAVNNIVAKFIDAKKITIPQLTTPLDLAFNSQQKPKFQ